MKVVNGLFLMALVLSFMACASVPVTRVNVQSFEIRKDGVTPNAAVAKMTAVLVDRGFDVKMTNTDSGIVTTEYKKFASIGSRPPFDYYMQIRTRVRAADGVTSISLIPAVKEQDRLNLAAFSEHELEYYIGDAENVSEIASMRPDVGWRAMAQITFMNIVSEAADAFGVDVDEVVQHVTQTPVDAGDVEN